MIRVLAVLCAALSAQPSLAQEAWTPTLYDPGTLRDKAPAADLVLPMPCGGRMAFQKVAIPMDASDPLADQRVRLGQTGSTAGYLDYLRNAFLRGGFSEDDGRATYFYLARYELTEAQYKALTLHPECGFEVSRRDTVAKNGVSWFEAVELSRVYSEYLRTEVPDALPSEDGQLPFVRLPNETEWEFAARGGAAVELGDFSAPRFPMDGDIDAYARFDLERSGPVGIKLPNPLGLFDMYGNLEELMLEPFRLNAISHLHGQAGGLVTRGGSFGSSRDQMRSAIRQEWPLYSRTGVAQAQESFGVRLLLTVHVSTSDPRVRDIRDTWTTRLESGPEESRAAEEALADIIAAELDPARIATLEGVVLELKSANEDAARATQKQIETTINAAVVFLTGIWDDTAMIDASAANLEFTTSVVEGLPDGPEADEYRDLLADIQAAMDVRTDRRELTLRGYRQSLDFLATDRSAEEIAAAAQIVERQLQEADNRYLLAGLTAMLDDFSEFRDRTDMSNAELLQIAVVR